MSSWHLARLSKFMKEQDLLERDIAAVDLRLVRPHGQLQLTPEAMARRQLVLDQRTKELKKAGQNI